MVRNSIKVYARVKRSSDQSQTGIYDIEAKRDCQEITLSSNSSGDCGFYRNSKLKYRFCSIFNQSCTQGDVFDVLAKPVVNSVLQGYNGTIFAYGQTGSGKTYSITGSSEYGNRGIIPRTVQYIFSHIQKDTNVLYNIYISYLEIYNEVGYDLLNPRQRATNLEELPRVTILEDSKGRIHLRNLSVNSVASEREAMCLMFLGDTNRTIAETPMNLYSSRSHCIFTIHIAATMAKDGRVRRSKLHLVDLAGSERIQKSGISGTQLVDAKQINLSLHYLEQVITALSDAKRAHVPYRNSVMTTVLRDSLGGNCLTAMLATLSIEPRNFEETISTCKFAQRVAMVNTVAVINEVEDPQLEISRLKNEIENLKTELAYHKEQTPFRTKSGNKTEMTPARMKECESHIMSYLKDQSDEFPIINDLDTVQTYFKIFKKLISSCQNSIKEKRQLISKESTKKYEEIIKRQNNEISILINLLDRNKSAVENHKNPQLGVTENGVPNSQGDLSLLNVEDQKSFQNFMNDSNNNSEANSCLIALEQKYKIAESLAGRIKMCKQNIVNLKTRMQQPDLTNRLIAQLKTQQNIYRETILEMQKLKNETDHLKHGLEQAKIRMLQRFQESQVGQTKNIQPFGTSRSSYVNFEIFDFVLEDSSDPFNNNIVPVSNMLTAPQNMNGNTDNVSDNQPVLERGSPLCNNSIVLTQNYGNPSLHSPAIQQNRIAPLQSSLITQSAPTYSQNSNRPIPHYHQQKLKLNYQNNQKPSFEQIPENYCLPNIIERTSNFHQQNPNVICQNHSIPLTRRENQDLQPPQMEKYQQKIPFDAQSVYGTYIGNQEDNILLPEVTQEAANVPCSNQDLNSGDNLHCQYNISQSIARNNRHPNYAIPSSTQQSGYADRTLPEKLRNIRCETTSKPEKQSTSNSIINYESNENFQPTPSVIQSNKYIPPSQVWEEGNQNINFIKENDCKQVNESDEEFLKDIPLTGDPEVDEEIIAFYRARQKAFKCNNE